MCREVAESGSAPSFPPSPPLRAAEPIRDVWAQIGHSTRLAAVDDDVNASEEPSSTIVFACSYETEAASREQYEDFAEWVEREELDGLSAYHFTVEGAFVIAVVDATGGEAVRGFEWTGGPFELSEELAWALIQRAQPGVKRLHYGNAGPSLNADGSLVFPKPPRG